MKSTYSAAQVDVISVYLTSSACVPNNYVALCSKVTFKLGIPANQFIETILKDEIKDKYLGNLPVSDAQYNITFVGNYPMVINFVIRKLVLAFIIS